MWRRFLPYHKDRNLYFLSSSMVAQAGQALAWPVSDDAGIPTPVWAITNERRNSVIAFLVVIGDLCYVTSTDTETPGHHSVGRHVSRAINKPA
ncbi:ash family protein [Shigella sonnei]|uniref:Ash family protein n=8 Tax=Enterobacterales TaxID=91347 RepID=A0AAW8AG83_KLEPN|nr:MULTISPECIES: ash family protein [Enterobacteriaceae]MBY0725051.1 ash family protein [Escherichia sp. M608]MCQ8757112.1 ash family protein [Escherichia coli DSM 30083 = JCM 1649 = ATCC 11775]MCR1802664.1 ash family protein [Escherichia coli O1:HNT]MCY5400721.1 ash family protein [Salmonella enterica subsp. enterica serovar 1,4,[5],12:i:-]MDI4715161.1 ash family protein [Salmonella enterica subsp. enterica serovar Lubbock]MDK8937594.1 ash family protein [Salmonella enterica subsp. enterica 